MVTPYLPDIIKGCVERVNDSFSQRLIDPFKVYFDKGTLAQVRRNVYESHNSDFPLVWFVFKYDEVFNDNKIYSVADFQLFICSPTDPKYTQQQREDNVYFPRLNPIATQLMLEIQRENWFVKKINGITHKKSNIPYFGLADVNGQLDQPNIFANQYIDTISINITDLAIKKTACTQTYSVLDVSGYPSKPS